MERQLTYLEAWDDFYTWARLPENWTNIKRPWRDKIIKAQRRHVTGKPSSLKCEGVKSIIMKCAPVRYRFEERVILIEL